MSGVLASTSASFVVPVFEIFAPLLSGGCAEIIADLLALAHRRYPASLVSAVPSVVAGLAAARVPAPLLPAGAVLVLAGEAVTGQHLAAARSWLPRAPVANLHR